MYRTQRARLEIPKLRRPCPNRSQGEKSEGNGAASFFVVALVLLDTVIDLDCLAALSD